MILFCTSSIFSESWQDLLRRNGSRNNQAITHLESRPDDISGFRSFETTIFLEVSFVVSGSRSQLRGVTNRVSVWRRDVRGSGLEGSLNTQVIHWTGSISGDRSYETEIWWELTLERERSVPCTSRGCIWSLKCWCWATIDLEIFWSLSCDLLRFQRNLLIKNLLFYGEEMLLGSSGTDIYEIKRFVPVLLWQWDLVNEGFRGKESYLIPAWKCNKLEELYVECVPSMLFGRLGWKKYCMV